MVQQRLRSQSFRRRRIPEVLLVHRVQHIGTRAAPHAVIKYFVGFALHVLGRLAARREEVALVGRLEVVEHGLGLFFYFLLLVHEACEGGTPSRRWRGGSRRRANAVAAMA